MMGKRSVLMGLIFALGLAACGDGGGTTEPPAEQFPRMVGNQAVFYFVPRANHNIQTINVAGSFNDWNNANTQFAMTRQPNGNWELRRQLPAGEHLYKFVINGEWVGNMCNDANWGNPAHGNRVDPALGANSCVDDGFGGQNGQFRIQ
jgi:hypothetical protein